MARAKGRILVVDDDTSLCEILESIMSRGGFEVRSEIDAEKARAQIAAHRPDLIILDLMMPRTGGLEFLQALNREGLGDIPVIVITGRYTSDPVYEGKVRAEPNVRDFLKKPLSYVDLIRRAEEVLQEHQGPESVL